MSSLSHRVVNLEAEAERRWEQSIAERLAVIDGASVAAQLAWLAETRGARAAVVRSCSGRSVAVSEIVRQMAAEAGLDAAVSAAAIREAEQVLRRLREA
jgi:FPC/CPF motif-containing protein YcgG